MRAIAPGACGAAAALTASLLLAGPALAQEAPAIDSGDTAWMLTSTALVLLMTIPGLALFYAGMVRKKNVLATMMQSFFLAALCSVVWMVAGYSLAFGEGGAWIGDLSRVFLAGTVESFNQPMAGGTIPETVFIAFQMTFAIITPALATGAVADRMKFSSLCVFTVLWSLLVYSPICHWVWQSNGWIFGLGALDFAGGTVVHINAGVAGLVAAVVLGKRTGYGTENMSPFNLALAVIGASMLWVGWFGFNAGSALAAGGRAGMALLVTQIAAATATIVWVLVEWVLKGKPSVLGAISGAVAGLVAVTPAAGFVSPSGALVLGIAAGLAGYWGATALKHWLGYDDSLDAFGVHGVCGIVGALLTGILANEAIGGTAASFGQFMVQLYSVIATIVYTGIATFILLKVVDMAMGLRVTEEEEREGLDVSLHGERLG
ncbi:ammonium transporter [Pseudoroseomonas globiformis]|uniref:Ammonium transporter n=1 Tax=Teichococcus globiformis TaxID=2307229 RepID=A0ABV7G2N4_9PROT